MFERTLRLSAPELVGGDLNKAEAVGFFTKALGLNFINGCCIHNFFLSQFRGSRVASVCTSYVIRNEHERLTGVRPLQSASDRIHHIACSGINDGVKQSG